MSPEAIAVARGLHPDTTPSSGLRRAAVFDVDGTLLPGTSAERLLVPYLVRAGVVGLSQLARAAARIASLPMAGAGHALRRNKRYLAGVPIAAVESLMEPFVRDELVPRLCPAVVGRLRALRAEGRLICLLSGTPDFVARALGAHLVADAAVGTPLERHGGRFTGRIDGTHYYGHAKRAAVTTLAARLGIDLPTSSAFADHEADVPFLDRFGCPVAVRPRRGLRREANRFGWAILEG